MWRASARALLHAPVKLAVIVVVWSTLLVALYALAMRGLKFLYDAAGFGPFLLDRLWYLFLFVVILMLTVSQLASAYSTLVRSPETRWWMSLPLAPRLLCRAKWLESSLYSAWAVLLLVLPLSLAHLRVLDRSLWLVVWLLGGLLLPLIGMVTALATLGLLSWLRWIGRVAIRRELLAVGFVVACGVVFWALGERSRPGQSEVWFVALQELLPRMQVAMSPWLPSSWVAKAFNASVMGRWVESGVYAALLWTTTLLAWRLLDHAGHLLLMPVLWRSLDPPSTSQTHAVAPFRVRRWMRHPIAASFLKDVLSVVREPMQWSQGVVFFGLLGAYFANMHRLTQLEMEHVSWHIGIASLNLACTLLVFGSLAVRFLFPQISLEGRSLWVLRMVPRGARYLLYGKLGLYSLIAVGLTEGLLWLSVARLGVPPTIVQWLGGVGVVASVTLVAMMVGLGAWWIDPQAQDPARIVSSSNGALALVGMLCYVGCVVGALVATWNSWLSASWWRFAVATVGLLIVSLAFSIVPLRQGLRRLERLDL
jgi:ABC-2 type transport system permease protein